MLTDRFLCCHRCSEVHHITEFDQAPIYDLQGAAIMEQPMDDRLAFLERHPNHPIEELTAVAHRKMPGNPSIDPMKSRYLEVSDGRARFVVRGFRQSVQEPLTYEFLSQQPSSGKNHLTS